MALSIVRKSPKRRFSAFFVPRPLFRPRLRYRCAPLTLPGAFQAQARGSHCKYNVIPGTPGQCTGNRFLPNLQPRGCHTKTKKTTRSSKGRAEWARQIGMFLVAYHKNLLLDRIRAERLHRTRNCCFVATKQHFLEYSSFRYNETMCFGRSDRFVETKHIVGTIDSSKKSKKEILGIFRSAPPFSSALALPLRSSDPAGRISSASARFSLQIQRHTGDPRTMHRK